MAGSERTAGLGGWRLGHPSRWKRTHRTQPGGSSEADTTDERWHHLYRIRAGLSGLCIGLVDHLE
jgi:hypothetical protein